MKKINNFIKEIIFWPQIRKYIIIFNHWRTAKYCQKLINEFEKKIFHIIYCLNKILETNELYGSIGDKDLKNNIFPL